MSGFSARNRQMMFEQLTEKKLDIIVIGGGITGAGIALDASARGLNIALFEMQDFASGTSSRSTKLIHGGLRYLKQLEVKVVAEVGRERAIVYENGPHVTTPEWMLLPLYKAGTFGKWSTTIGLFVYDFLAKVKKHERKKMLTKEQTLALEPLLKSDHLIGGGYYVEYKTDDARLTIEVIKKAVEKSAIALNYAKVIELLYEQGKVVGVKVEDSLTDKQYCIYAKKVINATGPWVDDIRELDQSKRGKTLRLTKGVHLVFDQSRFPLKQAIYFDAPDGRRMCFAIPRGNKTYFGTTDTNYDGDKIHPKMTKEDEHYLLNAVNYIFPSLKLSTDDIESSYAGLRPLIHQEGKNPSELSRKDEVFISASGLISIAGGKLTGYRKMAEDVVNQTLAIMRKENIPVDVVDVNTKLIPISGGDIGGSDKFEQHVQAAVHYGVNIGINKHVVESLARKYGTNYVKLLKYVDSIKGWLSAYQIDIESALMLKYGIEEEMVATVEDFLLRRTGYMLFDIEKAKQLKYSVAYILAEQLDWSEDQKQRQLDEFNKRIEDVKAIS